MVISVWLQMFIDSLCSASLQTVTMDEYGLFKYLDETPRWYRLRVFSYIGELPAVRKCLKTLFCYLSLQ